VVRVLLHKDFDIDGTARFEYSSCLFDEVGQLLIGV
jgi:hypothetical protein